MIQTATITSKKQLTIPAVVFRKANLRNGQKVSVTEQNGSLIITPVEKVIEELAGSIKLPDKWKGKEIDEIIETAKDEYFKNKYSSKQ